MQQGTFTRLVELAQINERAREAGTRSLTGTGGWSAGPEHLALWTFVQGLAPDDKRVAVALCWFGREDFDDYAAALARAQDINLNTVAGYLADKPALADYLLHGVARFDQVQHAHNARAA